MLSNLASYIFGASEAESDAQSAPVGAMGPGDPIRGQEEDWVVVGGDVQPALTLGSLDEVTPRPPTGSTGSSSTPSESGENNEMVIVDPVEPVPNPATREIALTRSARRLASPLSCPNGVTLPQMRALRASQKTKQKEASKSFSLKATERQNKAVKVRSNHPGKRNKAANLTFKASGFNKNLKQC